MGSPWDLGTHAGAMRPDTAFLTVGGMLESEAERRRRADAAAAAAVAAEAAALAAQAASRGTGEGARDVSTRVVTPALLENDPASPRGGDDPADDRPAAIPRWAFLRVGEALAQSGGNSDTLDPDVSYLDVDFDNDSPGRRDSDGRPPRPRSFFDPRAISDSHCSLEYSDLYEGNATLVMPALQRNTSEAASLAYSQSDGSLDNDGYVVMPCAPRVLVFFETTPSRARTP